MVDASTPVSRLDRSLPLTGAVMSKLPHYRIMPERFATCTCDACRQRNRSIDMDESDDVQRRQEAADYAAAFSQDFWELCALSGHIHQHHDTCFKYIGNESHRKHHYRSISSSRIYHAGTCAKRNHCDIAMTDKGTLLISIRCIRLAFYFERRPFFGVTRAIPSHPNLIGL